MSFQAQLAIAMRSAAALAANGDHETARETLDQALDGAARALGDDHPEVLAASRALAGLYLTAGEPLEARRILEESLMAGQSRLGEAHPIMLDLAFDLAILSDSLGNRHEARRNYRRVAIHGPAVLGHDHTYVQAAALYLGTALPTPQPHTGAEPPAGPGHPAGPEHAIPPEHSAQPGALTPDQPISVQPISAQPISAQPVSAQPVSSQPDASQADLFAQRVYVPDARPATPPIQVPEPEPWHARGDPWAPAPPERPSPLPAPAEPGPGSWATPAPGPGSWATPAPGRGRRTTAILAALSALATISAVAAVVYATQIRETPDNATGDHEQAPSAPATVAATSRPANGPPTGLALKDNGSSITLTWNDPAAGQVQFIVAGGPGTDLRTQRTTRETLFTLNGLNPRVEYCFTVAAVYDIEHVAVSDLICTRRISPSTAKAPSSTAAKPRKSTASDSQP